MLFRSPKPNRNYYSEPPQRLELLYFNQNRLARDWDHVMPQESTQKLIDKNHLSFEALETKAKAALPTLMAGKESRGTTGEWSVLMRPVLASKPACLSCHTNTKPNATLGVMVYAVRNSAFFLPPKR